MITRRSRIFFFAGTNKVDEKNNQYLFFQISFLFEIPNESCQKYVFANFACTKFARPGTIIIENSSCWFMFIAWARWQLTEACSMAIQLSAAQIILRSENTMLKSPRP